MSFFRKLFGSAKPTTAASPQPPAAAVGPADHEEPVPFAAAVRDSFERLYPGQTPFYYGTHIHFEDGGPDPLDGVSIFWNPAGPHWHYVSWGLSRFGCNLELTLRVAARPDEIGTEPAKFLGAIAYQAPASPITLLNMLARRMLRTKRLFGHGHWWQGTPNALPEFVVFATDPQLGTLTTPEGTLTFLQVTSALAGTIEEMKRDQAEHRGDAELDRLLAADPLLVSTRASIGA